MTRPRAFVCGLGVMALAGGCGASRARLDCSPASFAACAAPSLGQSSGACDPHDFPEDFLYTLRFTTNQRGAPESTCNRPVCQELLGLIQGATSSIDFAIYGLRAQSDILNALVAAQARGVVVRGVVDSENRSCTAFAYPDTATLKSALGAGNVVCDTGGGYSYIMHNKFFVIDGAKVWTGSTNVSDTETGGETRTRCSSKTPASLRGSKPSSIANGPIWRTSPAAPRSAPKASWSTPGSSVKSAQFGVLGDRNPPL